MKKLSEYLQQISSNPQVGIFEYLILFIIVAFTFYYGFASYAIENMNEGLYAEIPREMIIMGNYIIPHLNFVPYLEKPPLLYWLIALSYHIFGVSTFAARLVPVTAGAAACLAIFLLAKTLNFAKSGWIASIVLATSLGFIIIGRVIVFDMLLTVMFSLSVMFFYLWYVKEKRFFLWLSYAFLGLAFMTKGMLSIALVPCIAILFMFFNKTAWKKIIKSFDIIGIIIFLAVTAPWIIAASIKQPEFAWNFFINEQVMRFLNQRIPHDYHTGPFYFYLIPILGFMLPWTILLLGLLKRSAIINPSLLQFKKFLWLWFLVPIIFFSLSQAKASYYIIISIPALALLLGLKINEYFENGNSKVLLRTFLILMTGYIFLLLLICLILYNSHIANWFSFSTDLSQILNYPLLIILFLMVIIGVIVSYWGRRVPVVQFLLIASLIVPIVLFYVADKKLTQSDRSEISLGQSILTKDAKRPIYLYQDYEKFSSILFFVKKRVTIIDSESQDLYFGATTPTAKGWFISTKDFITQAQIQPVYVVIFQEKLAQFNNAVTPLKFCPVAVSGDVIIISNKLSDCMPSLAHQI